MIPELRKKFNENFRQETYEAFLKDLDSKHPGHVTFRVAETPIFIPKSFTGKMLDACESIVDIIKDSDFKGLTERAIPDGERVAGDDGWPDFIAFDFGVCINENGEYEPKLIEMQGFPSLFAFEVYYPEVWEKYFPIPGNFTHYMGGYNKESYLELLRKIILNGHNSENVILLEVKPHEQKTRIDFYCTQDYLGIPVVCLTELKADGKNLYYEKDGAKVPVKRIYNRVIFDDLAHLKDQLGPTIDLTQPYDVEWVPHPNWFYRVSKFTLPYINHPYVPETFFLNELTKLPEDLSQYVLKPLFSFAGQGVIIDVTKEDIQKIENPENWILQKKVQYADVIETPDIPAKAEIRIFYFWDKDAQRPVPVCNLARLSKGKMIGVRYNMDKEWVGGSVAYFEE
ncbi:MAG: hypothetical protein J5I50_02320 [Chitinophagaceae bacterium]|nr:hypothetical protein [Chitinophagaceae bacterium]